MQNAIKIIGGRFKGKKIPVLPQSMLRPTPNRVRETLFNWLMHDIRQANCLDAFAGSGALGLEAFSRGAKSVTFIEKDLATYQQLKKMLTYFNDASLSLLQQDALTYIKKSAEKFDVVFLDPPFHSNYLEACLKELTVNSILQPTSLVYIETAEIPAILEEEWTCIRYQQAGSVHYGLYQR